MNKDNDFLKEINFQSSLVDYTPFLEFNCIMYNIFSSLFSRCYHFQIGYKLAESFKRVMINLNTYYFDYYNV